MAPKTTCLIASQKKHWMLFEYLYNKYMRRGNSDYHFMIKNIAKDMSWNPHQVVATMKPLKERNIVIIDQERSKQDLWKTNFKEKTKEELLNEVISI